MGFFGRLIGRQPREQAPELPHLFPGLKSHLVEHPDLLNGVPVDSLGYRIRGRDPSGKLIYDIYMAGDPTTPVTALLETRRGYMPYKG